MTDLKYWRCDVCHTVTPYRENKFKHAYEIRISVDSADIVGAENEYVLLDVCQSCKNRLFEACDEFVEAAKNSEGR